MTTEIVPLSDLSDEAPGGLVFSPQLNAILGYLPKYPGCRVRIANALCNIGIFTVAALCASKRVDLRRRKNFGKKSLDDLEITLAVFGLAFADAPSQIVVPDQARPIDAHIQRLYRWIEEGLTRCQAEERTKELSVAGKAERRILTNIMLILDGREPSIMPEGEVSVTQNLKRSRIHLSLQTSDGKRSEITAAFNVTPVMLASAEDLLETLTTGERPPPKGLYETCAKAFGTTREDAKARLHAAAYGMYKETFDKKDPSV